MKPFSMAAAEQVMQTKRSQHYNHPTWLVLEADLSGSQRMLLVHSRHCCPAMVPDQEARVSSSTLIC